MHARLGTRTTRRTQDIRKWIHVNKEMNSRNKKYGSIMFCFLFSFALCWINTQTGLKDVGSWLWKIMKQRKEITRSLKAISTYSVILIYAVTSLFSRFFRLNRKWLLKSKKYDQIRVQHVRISRKRHLTCLYRTILVLAAILGEKRETSYARFFIKPKVTDRFCWFSIANTGYR